jgi:hypothetical protein
MMRLSVHPTRLRALLAAGGAAVALGLAPAAAPAATVSAASGKLTYTAARGEANHVTIAPWGLSLKVTETGTKSKGAVKVTVGTGCWKLSATEAACSNGASGVSFDGGDGSDYLDTTQLSSPLTASGGAGNDTLLARNGAADTLSCGDGADGGSADLDDAIATDCESLQVPELPVGPGETDPGTTDPGSTDPDPGTSDPGTSDPGTSDPGTSDPDTSDPGTTDPGETDPGSDDPAVPDAGAGGGNAVPPTIPAQTVGISASGVARVLVACPADSGGCRGTVTIELPQPAKKRVRAKIARAPRPFRLGRARFKAKAGTSKAVPVRLSKRGRQRILRSRRGRRARIVVTTRSADGKTSTITQDVTLRARPRARPRTRGRKVHRP